MRKNKILTAVMAFSMVASAFVGTVTASAAEITNGFKLVYNADKSSETTRAIEVYIEDSSENSVYYNLTINTSVSDYSGITKAEMTDWQALFDIGTNRYGKGKYKLSSASNDPDTEYLTGTYVGTYIYTVADANTAFTLNVDSLTIGGDVQTWEYNTNAQTAELDTITVPAFATEETVTAKSEAFVKEYEGVAAQAFSATLTAEQAAKSVTWVVTDGSKEKTVDTTVDTTVSGESDVVIGLVVSDAVEGLSATVTVK